MKNRHLIIFLLFFSLPVACSGVKIYRDTEDKNLRINTVTDSGSVFSKVRVDLEIYRVVKDCELEYDGTVQLKSGSVEVGIPSGRLSYLVFVFSSSDFLLNSSGAILYDTLLLSNTGYRYDVEVSYQDDIYNVVTQQRHTNDIRGREIELKSLSYCNQEINY